MIDQKRRVLFVCTGNACRSQMAESLLRQIGGEGFEVFSAGSHPAGFIHPLAIECMKSMGVPMDLQHSKSWDEFKDVDFDVVITLCDDAAGEVCPIRVGNPIWAHWSMPDPTAFFGTDEDRLAMALRLAERLKTKVNGLVSLDWTLGGPDVQKRLDFLGEI